jgi:hypothetical protein
VAETLDVVPLAERVAERFWSNGTVDLEEVNEWLRQLPPLAQALISVQVAMAYEQHGAAAMVTE